MAIFAPVRQKPETVLRRSPAFAHQPSSRASAVNAAHSAMPSAVGSSAASSVHFALPVSRRIVQSVVEHGQ